MIDKKRFTKNRKSTHDRVLYGFHPVMEYILKGGTHTKKLIIAKSRNKDARVSKIVLNASVKKIPVVYMDKTEIASIVGDVNHQGFLLYLDGERQEYGDKVCNDNMRCAGHDLYEIEQNLEPLIKSLGQDAFFLVLDQIQDPHNLGACLRTAAAAGVQAVIIPKDNAAQLTEAAIKTSSGAFDRVKIFRVTNIVRTLKTMKEAGMWIYGSDLLAENTIYEANLSLPLAFIMGSECDGMRRLTKENCDFLMKIPMFGDVQSLNISVAAGICLFEVRRQLLKFNK